MLLPFPFPKEGQVDFEAKVQIPSSASGQLFTTVSSFWVFSFTSSTSKGLWYFSGELKTLLLGLRKAFLTDEGLIISASVQCGSE